ncbi:alpha/beta fold hydrolase [Actinosynnema pretiosum]|uniref:Alpha/beta hydrolase n=1 Tax=Actinosynnema pretiosum TaxID=42197 RepID=A0A290Z9H4_9PSEU|nr:alpha/beta hydrolase [Actinosynnema pretiosum]ATE55667.1 alpha/beta hydrolase [Actinosynnema pretiosum]
MTQHLTLDGGTLAYDLAGDTGPLVVLAHGMGDSRAAYRFVAPLLVAAGHRVATVDLRGHGESSTGWPEHTRTAIAGDLVALIRHLGGPAVLVGHSISGGAATIAAATAPELVTALVELTPFTRAQEFSLRDLAHPAYRKGVLALLGMAAFGSTGSWLRYLELAHPGPRPADWDARQAEIAAMLREPGRMKALRAMGQGSPADAGAQLANVTCPVLVVQGELDPDWVSPRAEGEAVVADLPAGLGRLAVVAGAGHYPHVQFPERVVELVLEFLAATRA